jgi:hypothetical protein
MTMTCERFGFYSSSGTREVILSRYRLNLLGLLLDHGQPGSYAPEPPEKKAATLASDIEKHIFSQSGL